MSTLVEADYETNIFDSVSSRRDASPEHDILRNGIKHQNIGDTIQWFLLRLFLFHSTGTNNSGLSSNFIKSNASSKSSLADSYYDNVASDFTNPPLKRVDQPPPTGSTKNGTEIGKKASSILLSHYGNMKKYDKQASTGHLSAHSSQSSKASDCEMANTRNENTNTDKNESISMTNNRPKENTQNQGRLFFVSAKEPILHCRNSACNNQGHVLNDRNLSLSISKCILG